MGDWKCENCELIGATLILNLSDPTGWDKSECIYYFRSSSRQEISSSMPGLHNVYNALAAFSAASELVLTMGVLLLPSVKRLQHSEGPRK